METITNRSRCTGNLVTGSWSATYKAPGTPSPTTRTIRTAVEERHAPGKMSFNAPTAARSSTDALSLQQRGVRRGGTGRSDFTGDPVRRLPRNTFLPRTGRKTRPASWADGHPDRVVGRIQRGMWVSVFMG